jgi:hypothetical protein
MGLGEGETGADAEDVSDRLESEDQLEDTLQDGQEPPRADKDTAEDEKGLEMEGDFEGAQQEKDSGDKGSEDDASSKSNPDPTEEELEKEMGEVEEAEEKLDEQARHAPHSIPHSPPNSNSPTLSLDLGRLERRGGGG